MSWQKCLGCSGVYNTQQLDLTRYFHTCPPSVLPANARNENIQATTGAGAGLIFALGLGVSPTVAPPGAPPGMPTLVVAL